MDQEYIEELKGFLKENHRNSKFDELVERSRGFSM